MELITERLQDNLIRLKLSRAAEILPNLTARAAKER
jgi:hypothetical protein